MRNFIKTELLSPIWSQNNLGQNQRQVNRLKRLYMVALALIGLLTLVSQYFVRQAIQEQEADGRVINIAGRQRMLSQKISKTVVTLYYNADSLNRDKRLAELTEAVQLWEKSHQALQNGDAELKIPSNFNSSAVTALFQSIEPDHQAILTAAKQLLPFFQQLTNNYTPEQRAGGQRTMLEVLKHEPFFLKGMNAIVFQYDDEAKAKIDKLRTIEIILLIITILVLLAEAMFVFRPVVAKIQNAFEAIHTANERLSQANEELLTLSEELRQNLEELQTTQDQLNRSLQKVSESESRLLELNQNMLDSIQSAQRIQRAIFPSTNALNAYFPQHFIINKPKDIVSGDFYWFGESKEAFFILVADCTGHGVPGALMTVLGISELNAILAEEVNLTPGRILQVLNQRIKDNMTNEEAGLSLHDGMDVAVLSLDKQTKKLSFAGANRPLLRIDKDSEVHHYQPTKFPIGHYALDESDERSYETIPVPFAAGDRLYLFTDGITDQFSDQMKKMGKKGLYELLTGVHYQPIQFAQAAIEKAINEHKGQHDQTDDIMLLAIA